MHPHVRGFYATIPDSSALLSYESAILQLFVNLTALSYEGNFGTAATVLPPPFTDALRSLKHLRSLDLRAEAKLAFEDNAFSVGRDLPLLRHLGLVWDSEEASITRQLLRDPCPNLKSILLLDASPTEPYRHLPWSTLEDVVVTLPYRAAGTSAALELLEGIAAAAEAEVYQLSTVLSEQQLTLFLSQPSQLPLRHFRLEELIFGPPDVDIVSNSDAVALLKVLDAVRVPRLSLRLHGNINGLAGLPVLQAVERLSLELESGEFTRRTVFADFTAFLRRFPSLAELVISGGHFHSDYRQYYNDPPRTPPSTSYTPPSTDFFAAHPALLTFLLHLRTTTITRFVWEQIDDIRHCWQRGGLEEDFTVETYRY
ncbi:hypothetical protein JCM10213v2_005964 [Rhodosporidiobolus nylandii]